MSVPEHSISCTQLSWLFECCNRHKINLDKIIKDSPYPHAHLSNKSRFITWHSFANLVARVARYVDAEELRNSGRNRWKELPLLAQKDAGSNVSSVWDQYFASFGINGFCTQQYPFHTDIQQSAPSQLTIKLSMKVAHQPCIPLFIHLAGQMETLPSILGKKRAGVTLSLHKNGATYLVELPAEKAVSSWFGRLLKGLSWSRLFKQKDARLTEAHEQREKEYQATLEMLGQSRARQSYIEDRYQFINNRVTDIIWLLDEAGRVCYVSPSVYAVLGYIGEDCETTSFQDYFPSWVHSDINRLFNELLEGDTSALASRLHLETEMLAKDGTPVWFDLKAWCQSDGRSQPSILCVATNISRSKQLEHTLGEHTSSHQIITDAAPDAIITFNTEHQITSANPASFRLFGYHPQELIGTDIKTIMPLPLGETRWWTLYQSAFNHSANQVKIRGLRKDHSILPLEVSFVSYQSDGKSYQTCIIHDLSKTTALEQQLQASQKLNSLGQLSSEIAHDFNNLLVAIRGYADLALQSTSPDKLLSHLEEIKKAGQMGTDMTRKLLAFSRPEAMEPKLIDATELILGIRGMITRLLPANILAGFHFPTESAWLSADPTQLEQVLLNLALNARDAMPDGGELTIRLKDRLERESRQQSIHNHRKEDQLLIEVSDTGSGMTEEVRQKIFEPFYTTKPEGKGTGLGLAVVLGIIEQHAGSIEVESSPGEGTRFSIYLPKKKPPQTVQRHEAAALDTKGTETLLLVEDDQRVREVARLILVGAGYQVLPVSSGREAVEKFKTMADSIDLVLMDVMMPGLGARDAATQIRDYRPDVKLAFTSGYSADSIHTRFVRDERMVLITKPYGSEALRLEVRALLDTELNKTLPVLASQNRPHHS